jgi:hypothetical protein
LTKSLIIALAGPITLVRRMLLRSVAWFEAEPRAAAACMAIVAAVKLVFIRASEIVALPYDASLYIDYAASGYWANEALWKGHYPPGYPVWLELVSMTGLPTRIVTEATYLMVPMRIAKLVSTLAEFSGA